MTPRPPDVTPEMVAQWEASRQEWLRREPIHGAAFPAEAFYSGCYLAQRLRALGCTDFLADRICEAAGQRQANSDDYWGIVTHALDQYRQGHWEEPGPELAAKLLLERFGPEPDPIEVIATMAQHVPDKGDLFERMMTSRYVAAYGRQRPEKEEAKDKS